MAGTTVNENNLVYKTLRKAINEAGYDFSLEQVLAEGAGKEKKQAIRSILAAFANISNNEELTTSIYDRFIVQLTDAYVTEEVVAQDNATELFAALKANNLLTILNTGYDRKTAQYLINKLGWTEGVEFDGLVTASDVSRNRPNPDMIQFAMDRFNIMDGAHVAKIGDSIIDIEEGKNAGCSLNIGITTGAHTAEQLQTAYPDKIIDNLIDLLPILYTHNNK